ncbi:MAG: hypothetical protein ACI4QT_07735, partial [Kiritimatiellia bacterium]
MADEGQMGGSSFCSTETVAANAAGANGRAEARPSRVTGAADSTGAADEQKLVPPMWRVRRVRMDEQKLVPPVWRVRRTGKKSWGGKGVVFLVLYGFPEECLPFI